MMLRKAEVVLGRATQNKEVDVNLAEEAPGFEYKISREQATIKLKEDGSFYLLNVGKRPLRVNETSLEKYEHVRLPDTCLLEVAGVTLVFEANRVMINRLLAQARGVQAPENALGGAL